MGDIDRELVGFFRAAGSVLDCLAAVSIVVLRLPVSIKRASGDSLVDLARRASQAEDPEKVCWERTAQAFETQRHANPAGWFDWTLEMRNAVVHRARQLRTWLPRPSTVVPAEQRLRVATGTPQHRLMRDELHLRRSPWLADLDALSSAIAAADNWLPEPAPRTVLGILERELALTEAVVATLASTWDEVACGTVELSSPADSWAPRDLSDRAKEASHFKGFDPGYEVPPLTSIVMHPREATRAQIAEGLRQEGIDLGEVEG